MGLDRLWESYYAYMFWIRKDPYFYDHVEDYKESFLQCIVKGKDTWMESMLFWDCYKGQFDY